MVLELELQHAGGDRRIRGTGTEAVLDALRVGMTVVGFDTSMPATTACVIPGSRANPVCSPVPDAARLTAAAGALRGAAPAARGAAGAGGCELGRRARDRRRCWSRHVHGSADRSCDRPRPGAGARRASAPGVVAGGAGRGGRGRLTRASAAPADRCQAEAGLRLSVSGRRPLELVWGPLALDPEDLLARVRDVTQTPLAIGDWALESRSALEAAGIEVPAPDSGLHAVSALQICRLGMAVEPVAAEQVNPVYVRVPDAEITRSAGVDGPDRDRRS